MSPAQQRAVRLRRRGRPIPPALVCAALLAALAGCLPAIELEASLPEGARTLLVAYEREGVLVLAVRKVPPAPDELVFVAPAEGRAVLAYFSQTTEALGVIEGPTAMPASSIACDGACDYVCETTRPPPTALAVFEVDPHAENGQLVRVQMFEQHPLYRRIRVPELFLAECADGSMCISDAEWPLCVSDCGEETPAPPQPPELGAWSCAEPNGSRYPGGWETNEAKLPNEETLEFCGPLTPPEPCRGACTTAPDGSRRPFEAACGDAWPSDLPAVDVTFYVDASGSPGDGSRTRPFDNLDAAFDAAAQTTSGSVVIALAEGGYAIAPRTLDASAPEITVAGVCAENTQVQGRILVDENVLVLRDLSIETSGAESAVDVTRGHLTLEDVVVTGTASGNAAVTVRDGAVLRASRVALRAVASAGLEVVNASVLVEGMDALHANQGLRVRGRTASATVSDLVTRTSPSAGLSVVEVRGGRLSLERALLLEVAETGIVVSNSGSTTLRDVHIWSAKGLMLGRRPMVFATGDGYVEAQRLRIDTSTSAGIVVNGASIDAADVLIRDLDDDVLPGIALHAKEGEIALQRGALLMRRRAVAVAADGEVRAEHVVLGRAGAFADAMISIVDGNLSLTRAFVSNDRWTGLHALGQAPNETSADLRLGDVHFQSGEGPIIELVDGVALSGKRVLVEDFAGAGLAIEGQLASARFEDLTVRSPRGEPPLRRGPLFVWGSSMGVAVGHGSDFFAKRFLVDGSGDERLADARSGDIGFAVVGGEPILTQGIIRGSRIGLLWDVSQRNLYTSVRRVRFEGQSEKTWASCQY